MIYKIMPIIILMPYLVSRGVDLSFLYVVIQMADSMEVTILAIVCPAIRCEWQLETWQEATITTVRPD